MTKNKSKVAVVMVPLPAQGHLNQLLHLSRLISAYDIPVHYVGATTHSRQAKLRVHGFDPHTTKNINFHEFQTPSFDTPMPNPNASHKFPNHLIPSFYATSHLREPVCSLVSQLLSRVKRVVVIYDSAMTWVVENVPKIPNVECYCFNSISAFHMYSYFWEVKGRPGQPGTEVFEDIQSIQDCFPPEFWEFWKFQENVGKISSGELYNSSRVIEGLYLDLVAKEYDGLKQWAIGPFNPLPLKDDQQNEQQLSLDFKLVGVGDQQNGETCNFKRHRSLDWLDKQEPNSVIFVSFGTTTTLSNEEIGELAIGLERSKQKFVWVLRDADKGDVFVGEEERRADQLPEGFEERMKGRGIIVRDWAPQLEVLAHPSTGGFMSHCGWNSCMESISMGIPIAAWPMHSDQPRNSQLVTKFLKIGLMVRHWEHRDEVVTSKIVEKAVRTLMSSPEGDEMRKKASELSIAVKQSVMDGGINSEEMDSFISHITR